MKAIAKKYRDAVSARIILLVSSLFLCSNSFAAEPDETHLTSVSETARELLLFYDREDLVVEAPHRRPTKIRYVAENMSIITAEEIRAMNAHSVGRYLWWGVLQAQPGGRYDDMIFDLHYNKDIFTAAGIKTNFFVSVRNLLNGSYYWADFMKNPGRWMEAGLRIEF